MNNFQKELASTWVKDKDSSIDWLGGPVTFKGLMNSDTIYVSIINKPNDILIE